MRPRRAAGDHQAPRRGSSSTRRVRSNNQSRRSETTPPGRPVVFVVSVAVPRQFLRWLKAFDHAAALVVLASKASGDNPLPESGPVPHHEASPLDVVPKLEKHMSTTAPAAVLTKFASLNSSPQRAIVGLAVAAGAAGAVGGAPAVAHTSSFPTRSRSLSWCRPSSRSRKTSAACKPPRGRHHRHEGRHGERRHRHEGRHEGRHGGPRHRHNGRPEGPRH